MASSDEIAALAGKIRQGGVAKYHEANAAAGPVRGTVPPIRIVVEVIPGSALPLA
jgi:hypothetical protein